MLSGRQIHMATKDLLMENPYRNIYYVEDRILWNELAVLGKLISIDHKPFFRRIPLKKNVKQLQKNIKTQISSMRVNFLYSPSRLKTLKSYLHQIFKLDLGTSSSTLNFLLLFPCFLESIFSINRVLISQIKGNTRDMTIFNLKNLEEKTSELYGNFNLNIEERKLFNI